MRNMRSKIKSVYCTCKDWEINWPKVICDTVFMQVTHGGKPYDGELMVYCPWCGDRLKKIK
jgi:uncharacterized Zn-finger protein